MKFNIDELEVIFPFDMVYSEQYDLMCEVKRALGKGHALVECPTGTGKTVALLSVIIAWQQAHPSAGKLIYATRTVPEMTKCMEELKLVLKAREDVNPTLALCLSSRKNMCIHKQVINTPESEGGVDAGCRKKTAPWVRQQFGRRNGRYSGRAQGEDDRVGTADETDVQELWEREQQQQQAKRPRQANAQEEEEEEEVGSLCSFYEDFMENPSSASFVPAGVYTLDDMRELGEKKGWCPYFMARHCIELANIVVYNFQYLLDPKVANLVSKELARESVVVFDEAHNVDNVCIEALSVNFNRRNLELALSRIGSLGRKIDSVKQTDRDRLAKEYEALVRGLQEQGALGPPSAADSGSPLDETGGMMLGSPVLPTEILNEAVPGSIRKAEYFIQMLSQVVTYLKQKMDEVQVTTIDTPQKVLLQFEQKLQIEAKPLKFAHARLDSLMRTLQVVDLDEYSSVSSVCDFLTLVSTYRDGFSVIMEPFDGRMREFKDPILQLACLDASIAIRPVFKNFDSVVITSGTLSPIDLYPKILSFDPRVSASLAMSITRPCIFPIVVTRGSDQSVMTSEFRYRDDPSTNRNFGQLLIEVSATVPDGVVCFFTAYEVLEQTVAEWDANGILSKVLENKLVFIETKDVLETTLALDNFRRACDAGRGAVFLSIARGKVSEGIDFSHHYGRAVILFGIPYQYTKSVVLQQRLEYLRRQFDIKDSDFLTFDAIRSAAQCLGRVLRSKQDWGIMVLADRRYNNESKSSKLPPWIRSFLTTENSNLSIDEAVSKMREFLRTIAQPLEERKRDHNMLDGHDANKRDADRREMEQSQTRKSIKESWE